MAQYLWDEDSKGVSFCPGSGITVRQSQYRQETVKKTNKQHKQSAYLAIINQPINSINSPWCGVVRKVNDQCLLEQSERVLGSGCHIKIKEVLPSTAHNMECLLHFLTHPYQVLIYALGKNCSSSHVPYSLMPLHLFVRAPFPLPGSFLSHLFLCSFDCSFISNLIESYLSFKMHFMCHLLQEAFPGSCCLSPGLSAPSMSRVLPLHVA